MVEDERAFRKALSLVPEGERSAFVKGRKEVSLSRTDATAFLISGVL